jgi:DNA-directed RNA polymerase subunit H (RpoH/RPB5)
MTNPLTHSRVPLHRVLSKAQAKVVLRREKVDDIERVPSILFTDPVLEALRLDGKHMEIGDLVEITRPSLTTVTSLTWRVIVNE